MVKDDFAKVLLGVVSARFGPGAIGRIGTITISALVVFTLIAAIFAFINIYCSLAIVLLTMLLAFYSIDRAFRYAERHPEIAAMDGAQISKVLTQQASMKPLPGLAPPPEYATVPTQNPMIDMRSEEQQ